MAIVYTDNIEPRKPTQEITLGTTGETITFPGNDLRVNTVKDKGGNTLWTSDGSGNLSSVNAGLKGNFVLLSTQTASSSASIEFTSGIDSTYDVYIFKFIDINPATDTVVFEFNASTDGGSNYNVTKTTTFFYSYHWENDTYSGLGYITGSDLAQSTSYQQLMRDVGNGSDECGAGELHLFAPSSTTYVKQFYARTETYEARNSIEDSYIAGYLNTASAINAISFKVASGNFDGTIKMYGLL